MITNTRVGTLLALVLLGSSAGAQQAINDGLSGAWFDPTNPGQGLLFDVDEAQSFFFVAWFTFEEAGADGSASGVPRWLTAQGSYAGSTADLVVAETTGGTLAQAGGTVTAQVGTLSLSFESCTAATASYALNGGVSGTIAIERLTPTGGCAGGAKGIPAGQAIRVETLAADFDASGDVSVGPSGDLFVGNYGSTLNDSTGATVTRVDLDGNVSTFATGLNGASGNVFDADGNLYQSSIRDAAVIRVAPDGTTEVYASGITGGVIGLAFDSRGNLYANSCGENRIYRIAPDRTVSVFAQGFPLSCPNGLTSDPDDNLYAVNFNNGAISRIDPTGTVSLLARTPAGTFRSSGGNGHVTFGNGRLYTVSNASSQVFEVGLDGTLTVLAGSGQRGHADGDPETASFQMPNGIDISADGRRLFLNESESLRPGGLTGTYPLTPNRLRMVMLEDVGIDRLMTGAWFTTTAPGQGFLWDVITDTDELFLAWFTYTADGSGAQRWYTLQGPFDGSAAPLEIFETTGGVFDAPGATSTERVGVAELTVDACDRSSLSFAFDAGPSGSLALEPLLPGTTCPSGR
ncbi:MAG: hypothetical protein AAGE01_03025 [Pseudomonadota bacterium]